MMIRLSCFSILVVTALLLPWWATLLGVLYYTRFYSGVELVVAMLLIDAYMGVIHDSPWLTIGTFVLVTGMASLRSWLRTHAISP